jgi:DNA-binding MarR family transcriptional regulator
MKYNRRKIKNIIDRHSMYNYLSTFTKVSDTILTTKQLNVLGIVLFITKSSTKQKMCIKDLGKYLKCNTHSSLSRLVKSLKTKGFLNTNKEGRVVFISLSTMGMDYLNSLYEYFNRNSAEKKYNTPIEEDILHILNNNKKRKAA